MTINLPGLNSLDLVYSSAVLNFVFEKFAQELKAIPINKRVDSFVIGTSSIAFSRFLNRIKIILFDAVFQIKNMKQKLGK
jgi:hypothetical protein